MTDACDPFPHMHRGRCYRAGVKAGEAGLRQAIEALADDMISTRDPEAILWADELRRVLDDHQETP